MNSADGLYFRHQDYASFWRRLLVDVIDGVVVGVPCLVLVAVLWESLPTGSRKLDVILAALAAIAFCYFVVLKRSRLGTAGYRICGVRIVGLNGEPASFSSLSLRLVFAVLGPLNWLDLIWLSGDPHRQALRDKLTRTYVVKKNARPVGTGKIRYRYYEMCGYSFLFQEVQPDPEPRVVPAR